MVVNMPSSKAVAAVLCDGGLAIPTLVIQLQLHIQYLYLQPQIPSATPVSLKHKSCKYQHKAAAATVLVVGLLEGHPSKIPW
jgi:hypothetical protein